MNTSDETENTELRSEKVRKLIGEIPRSLEIRGWIIMAVVSIALLAAVCLLHVPYSNGETVMEYLLEAG